MAVEIYEGTPGGGKSYHSLERIVDHIRKGKPVIANFPLKFSKKQLEAGWADLFMYVPDSFLMAENAPALFAQISVNENWFAKDEISEGHCLAVIDEAGTFFDPQITKGKQQLMTDWKTLFTQHRKLKYDFIIVCQDTKSQINRTISKCAEYLVKHRKINNIFPFSLLPFTIFAYNTYWTNGNQKLKTESGLYSKKFASMYNSYQLFGNMDNIVSFEFQGETPFFGNCKA